MKRRERSERRAQARAHAELVHDLERLAQLAPGGSPERPSIVDSAAVVDVRAVADPCPLCSGPLRLEEHAAVTFGSAHLRAARVLCTQCGTPRTFYFSLRETRPN